jgi:hypothetical protein
VPKKLMTVIKNNDEGNKNKCSRAERKDARHDHVAPFARSSPVTGQPGAPFLENAL